MPSPLPPARRVTSGGSPLVDAGRNSGLFDCYWCAQVQPGGSTAFAGGPVDELAGDVEVAGVAGVLLQDVQEDPVQLGCLGRTREAAPGSGVLGQGVLLDNHPGPSAHLLEASQQGGQVVVRRDPAVPV